MVLACALMLASVSAAPAVTDFYPATPGLQRTYEVQLDSQVSRHVETVGATMKIDGKEVFPVTSSVEGADVGVTYYGFEGDTLSVMATRADKLLAYPIPILKVGAKTVKWNYLIDSPVLPIGKLTVNAESTLKGQKSVLGQKRDVVEVKLAAETAKGAPVLFRTRQTITFAKGVGPVEWDDESVIDKRNQKRKIKLVDLKVPVPKS